MTSATETTTKKEAVKRLRQMRSTGLTLTAEVAKLVVAAGGPTFKTVNGGFRCNQTGEKVGRGGTENYRQRIHGLATPPKIPKTNSQTTVADQPQVKKYAMRTKPAPNGNIYCPRCRRPIGHISYMPFGVEMACWGCGDPFIVR